MSKAKRTKRSVSASKETARPTDLQGSRLR